MHSITELIYRNYITNSRGNASYLPIFKSGITRYLMEQIRSEKKDGRHKIFQKILPKRVLGVLQRPNSSRGVSDKDS